VTAATVPAWADPVSVAGRASEGVLELWEQLLQRATVLAAPCAAADAPEPARRWLAHAIGSEVPAPRVAVLKMTGHIKIGRWLPFRAVEVIAPPYGFVWVARAGWGPMTVTGFDSWGNGQGRMHWLLGGRIPLVTASGPDVARSGAARVALEAVWVPPTFIDVSWEQSNGANSATAIRTIGEEDIRVELRVGDDGRLTSVRVQRWSALGVDDQYAQDSSSLREMVDLFGLARLEAQVDELGQPAAGLVQHAQSPVPGSDQRDSRLDDPAERRRERQVGADGHDGVDQVAQAVGILDRRERHRSAAGCGSPETRRRSDRRAAYAAASLRRAMPSLVNRLDT
jgi:hypothetical protein